ncbi:MAG: hypothetical protein AW10_04160 [Candidatus Accumulibacter appositus]|uniref:Uncharacterized protein n=1 Tax=Candidatus Accumulibacter appositus TaxID=1454003 RepID=A0A011PI80_9PROT|nr:MAG: hypothetical protein AW10_04160 [Candidatus Accumulibacter appositus]
MAVDCRRLDHRLPLVGGLRPHARGRGQDEGALDDIRPALRVEEGDQRFADAEFGDRRLGVETRIGAQRLRGRADGFLVTRREGAQRVLDAVAELAENAVGNVERILGDEIDADAFRANQAHHLFDLFQQGGRRFAEQQVRLVEEEHQLRFFDIADFGQLFEKLGQQPEQESRVQPRRSHQLVGGEDVDHSPALLGLHQVGDVEHRLAEENVPALVAEIEQAALDGADRRRRDIAVLAAEALGILADVLQHRPQILEVEEQQAVVVGNPEHQLQDAGLGIVEGQQTRQQHRPHVRNRRPHGVTLLTEDVPESDRAFPRRVLLDAQRIETGLHLRRDTALCRQTREITLDIGHEHRHADLRKTFGEHLQGHRFSGTGGAGNQAVPIGKRWQQDQFGVFVLGDGEGFAHGRLRKVGLGGMRGNDISRDARMPSLIINHLRAGLLPRQHLQQDRDQ